VSGSFSWNLLADIQDMWQYDYMVNAYRAGTVVAVLAALIGWFMVLRRQSFAGHTLALVGFPGAAAAVWLGVSVALGYFAFCLAAALVIAAVARGARRGFSEESAVIGTVQTSALATGMLFVSLYKGFLNGTTALLFGAVFGITAWQVTQLVVVAVPVLAVLAVIGRPLLFASVDPDVARAHGVPASALDTAFLLLLAAAAAEVSQITGALLVFALLVLPPATAQLITARPVPSLVLAVTLALLTVWVALFVSYYSPFPIGFWLTSTAFSAFVLTGAMKALAARRRPARAPVLTVGAPA
jgi:zinc/manganese transport system permease protein